MLALECLCCFVFALAYLMEQVAFAAVTVGHFVWCESVVVEVFFEDDGNLLIRLMVSWAYSSDCRHEMLHLYEVHEYF